VPLPKSSNFSPPFRWFTGVNGRRLGTTPDSLPLTLGPWPFPSSTPLRDSTAGQLGIIAGDVPPQPPSAWLGGPDDGKVTVASTHLAGELAHRVLSHSHTWLQWRAHTHRAVSTFFATGRFRLRRSRENLARPRQIAAAAALNGRPAFTSRMKLTPLLLTVSLVANVALLAFVATRPSSRAPAAAPATAPTTPTASANSLSAALRAALAAGDAGRRSQRPPASPADVARELALGRALRALPGKLVRAARATASDRRPLGGAAAPPLRQPLPMSNELLAQRELDRRHAPPPSATTSDSSAGRRLRHSSPSSRAEKRAALRRISAGLRLKRRASSAPAASSSPPTKKNSASSAPSATATSPPSSRPPSSPTTSSAPRPAPPPSAPATATRSPSEADFRKLFARRKSLRRKNSAPTPSPAASRRRRCAPAPTRSSNSRPTSAPPSATTPTPPSSRSADPELRRARFGLVTRVGLPAATTERVAHRPRDLRRRVPAHQRRPRPLAAAIAALNSRPAAPAPAPSSTPPSAPKWRTPSRPAPRWVGMLQNGLAFTRPDGQFPWAACPSTASSKASTP